jgi:hypothetical protein
MYFYDHAHRLRLKKLLYLELSRSPNGFFYHFWSPLRAKGYPKQETRNTHRASNVVIFCWQVGREGVTTVGPVSTKNHPAPGVALAVLLTTFPALRPELRFSGGSCGLAKKCRGKKVGQ